MVALKDLEYKKSCSLSLIARKNLSDLKWFDVFSFVFIGLYLSDIPLHDATRDLILLSERFEQEYKLTKKLEIMTDQLQQTYRDLEEEKRKTDRSDSQLLNS